ncbi:MAG TPA: hypothetical protein VH560_18465 [Polyangia bacterium]|jgi:hypothetical protein|nr:hypothetical protein [Polyangia bacterium]
MSRARGLSFDGMLVGLLFVVVVFGACLTVAQADTFWALRAGQDIWRTGHVPRVDAYSFTAFGLPWPDHEWLWQAIAYPIFRAGSFPLLTAFAAGLIVAAVAVVYRLTVGAVPTRFVLVALAIPLSSLVWTLRPQLVTLLALAVLLTLLVDDRAAWLPPLFLVWANAHGGVALGGVVLVAAWGAAWLRAVRGAVVDRRRAWRLTVALPLCALATAATPLGFGIFSFVVTSEARLRAAHVSEWLPPSLGLLAPFWILVAAFVALAIARRRQLRAAPWADWVCVVATFALLPFALRSVRQVGPWLLLAPAAASRLLGADFRWRRRTAVEGPDHPRLNALIVAMFAGVAALCIGVAWAMPLPRLGWRPVPEAALAALRACPDRLYNHYDEGGYLVWLLPERKVFVDSRQDPYPLPFLIEHARIELGQAPYEPVFRRWDLRCAFLREDSPTRARLAADGWTTRFHDDTWAVLTAPGAVRDGH